MEKHIIISFFWLFCFQVIIAQNITKDTVQANTYVEMAGSYSKLKNLDSSNICYKKASDIYLGLLENRKNISTHDTLFAERFIDYQNQIVLNLLKKQLFDSSIVLLQQNLKTGLLYIGEKNRPTSNSMQLLGRCYRTKTKFDSALKYYQKSLQIRLDLFGENNLTVAAAYNNVGMVYLSTSDYDMALDFFLKDIQITTRIIGEDNTSVATSYVNIGTVYMYKDEYAKSLQYYQKALPVYLKLLGSTHPDITNLYNNIANIYYKQDEYKKALEYYDKALSIRLLLYNNKNIDVALSYSNIGNVYSHIAQYDKALDYLQKGLQIRIEIFGEKHSDVGASYNNIGLIYIDKGEFEKAQEYIEKALQIRYEILGPVHLSVAASYGNMGLIYEGKNEFNKAFEFYNKALQIELQRLGENHTDVASTYNNIGNTFNNQGDYTKALEYYTKSLQIRLGLLDEKHTAVARSYNNLGSLYRNLKEYNKALEYFRKALNIRLELFGPKHADIAKSYNNIARVLELQKKHSEALKYYQKAIYSNLPDFNDSTDIRNVSSIYNYLGYDELLKSLEEKAQILSNHNLPDLNKITCLKIALRHYQAADTVINQVRQSNTNEIDKLRLAERSSSIYEQAIGLCKKLNSYSKKSIDKTRYNELAFNFSEKNKGMILYESLSEKYGMQISGIPDSLLVKENDLRIDIKFYQTKLSEGVDSAQELIFRSRLFTATRTYDSLQTVFENNYPDYYILKHNTKTVSISDLQKILDVNTQLRSYALTDTVLYVFTITKNLFEVYDVPIPVSFPDSINLFRIGLKYNSQQMKENYRRLGYWLYVKLFPDSISKTENLIIVPDGCLAIIPFETLLSYNFRDIKQVKILYDTIKQSNRGELISEFEKEIKFENYWDYPFLIKKFDISYSYSATLWYQTVIKKTNQQILNDFLAIAPVFSDQNEQEVLLASREYFRQLQKLSINPGSENDSLALRGISISRGCISSLPGTENEVKSIFKLFNDNNSKALVQLYNNANEKFVKSTDMQLFRFIHFATHGFVNSEKADLSGILLAQDSSGGNDGILYASEIFGLKFNADLITLSACETGLGKIRKGEGIIGLSRALMYAGTRNLMVSLWPVPDESTAKLMINFYQDYMNSNQKNSFSNNLRTAKLKLIREKKYAQPMYWSPFILVGE